MRKSKILAAALCLSFLATACKPMGKVKSPEDYLPFVVMGLEAASTAAVFGQAEAKKQGAFGACVTTGVLGTAFSTASDAMIGYASDAPEIPAVEVDVSACLEFAPDPATGKEVSEEVRVLVDSWAGSVLKTTGFYLEKIKDTDCKGYQGGMAAVAYVEGVLDPIVDEIDNPDGKLSLPAVPINLAACEG